MHLCEMCGHLHILFLLYFLLNSFILEFPTPSYNAYIYSIPAYKVSFCPKYSCKFSIFLFLPVNEYIFKKNEKKMDSDIQCWNEI